MLTRCPQCGLTQHKRIGTMPVGWESWPTQRVRCTWCSGSWMVDRLTGARIGG